MRYFKQETLCNITMELTKEVIFVLLLNFGLTLCEYPPIDKCLLSDNDCLKASAQKALIPFTNGISELETDMLDVMNIKIIKFELAGLKLDYTDAILKGLKKTMINKLKFNSQKNVMELKVTLEDLVLRGHYVASGRLLILPINGDGILTIKIKKLLVDAAMPYEMIKVEDGKDAIDLKSFKFNFDFKDNVNFNLTNLFNGNKELSDAMHFFMNENWKQVADEFGRPIIQAAYQIVFDNVKKFMKQPLEQIALS